jgi:hypothetical protein
MVSVISSQLVTVTNKSGIIKLSNSRSKRSVGRPQARWSDDLRRTAGRSWRRVAEDRAKWRDIGEAYVDG